MAAVDTALGAASKIGAYFSVISFVPAIVATTTTAFLVAAKPWTGTPQWHTAAQAFATPSLGQLGGLLVAGMVLAMVLHPLQFSLVQTMEGYWGTSWLGLGLAQSCLGAQLDRLDRLLTVQTTARSRIEDLQAQSDTTLDELARQQWTESEGRRLAAQYPEDIDDVMPTMLGNSLRRYERLAGAPYNLNIITTAGHLLLVADQRDTDYVRDQRTQLDLATRMAATCAALAVTSAALLLPAGWWILLAAVPYLLAVMFYRGACTVAREYGSSLQALLDLNRPALYARLGIPQPTSLDQERAHNVVVQRMLGQRKPQGMRLAAPPPPPPPPGQQH